MLTSIATQEKTSDGGNSISINILGLRWNPTTDKIMLATKSPPLTSDILITKREILYHLSKIFDPLGFIAPVVIRGKILIQKLWQSKVTWDEPLSDDLRIEWKKDLNEAKQFTVSRWYFDTHVTHPTLRCFADASQHAYGLVFFVQGKQVSFVLAKTRVAPLKALTIPRLELMATLVGARLTKFVLQAIPSCDPSVFVWSDSQIVLHWVGNDKPLPTFVNR